MITQTLSFDTIPPGGQGQGTFIQPVGMNKLRGLYFNPGIDVVFTVKSQKKNVLILDGFRSSLGLLGFVPIDYELSPDDRYIVTAINREATDQSYFLTALFDYIPPGMIAQPVRMI